MSLPCVGPNLLALTVSRRIATRHSVCTPSWPTAANGAWPKAPADAPRERSTYTPREHETEALTASARSYLPEGTTTYVHLYSLQRDPRYFSSPDAFYPDRWLRASSPSSPSPSSPTPEADPGFVHDTRAYAPFSFGPNNCVGRGLALQEMRMLAALLVRRFEMRFPDGWEWRTYEEGLEDWFVIQKPALRVVLTPRVA